MAEFSALADHETQEDMRENNQLLEHNDMNLRSLTHPEQTHETRNAVWWALFLLGTGTLVGWNRYI